MNIIISEITNDNGPINKCVSESGKKAQAAVYGATGRTVNIPITDVSDYITSLGAQPSKALVLGVSGLDEFKIRLKGREDIENGIISRTKEYFKYCNSDSVSLMYLDVDGGSAHGEWSEEEVGQFIDYTEEVLSGCIIGKDGESRNTLCRWIRESSSAGVLNPEGKKSSNGLHIFFPVRNADKLVIEYLFKLAWLRFKSHMVTRSGNVLARTVVDEAVKTPERLVFESDCTVEGDYSTIPRGCEYVPGGVLDAELAVSRFDELGIKEAYDYEVKDYLNDLKSSPEVQKVKKDYDALSIDGLTAKGVKRSIAKRTVKSRRAGVLLSTDFLIKDDMSEVSVLDVLLNGDDWNEVGGFRPPLEPEYGAGKCKIFVNDDRTILNSFAHGGEVYELKFDPTDLLQWIKDSPRDEIEDWYEEFLLKTELSKASESKLAGRIADKLDLTKTDIRLDLKDAVVSRAEDIKEEDDANTINPESTHHRLSVDILKGFKDYRVFGGEMYAFDKTIWNKKDNGILLKAVGTKYEGVKLCRTGSQYAQVVKHTLATAGNKVDAWRGSHGFPCSNSFWRTEVVGDKPSVDSIPYDKDLGARFKLTFEPDFEMKTPMFDQLLHNVVNVECLQKGLGLAMCGSLTDLQQAIVMKGPGGVGKGTLQRIMLSILPRGRVTALSFGMLNVLERVIGLKDSVINFIPEVKKNTGRNDKPVNTAGFKMATGRDLMSGRNLFRDTVEFECPCSFVVSMNAWPRLDSFSSEIERRLSGFIVEFQHNHNEVIDGMEVGIIAHELPGVLAWLINGVKMWIENKSVDAHSGELFRSWAQSVDSVETFILDKCRIGHGMKVLRTGMWDKYKEFCIDGSMEQVSRNEFYNKVEEVNNVFAERKEDGRYFNGICLEI